MKLLYMNQFKSYACYTRYFLLFQGGTFRIYEFNLQDLNDDGCQFDQLTGI